MQPTSGMQYGQYNASQYAHIGQAVTDALSYGRQPHNYGSPGYPFNAQNMSPHYYQAYLQSVAQAPPTNSEGYTMSSTYDPTKHPQNAHNDNFPGPSGHRGTNNARPRNQNQTNVRSRPSSFNLPSFNRKKEESNDSWDADPSLKGKIVPIQGTSIVLDTPEAIEAWVAERKRRFPTTERVNDKKRKLEEAAARGQLPLEEVGLFGQKRRRVEDSRGRGGGRGRGQRGQTRGRGRGRGGSSVRQKYIGSREAESTGPTQYVVTAVVTDNSSGSSSSSESDDEVPEVVTSKASPAIVDCPQDEKPRMQGQVVPPLPKLVKKPIPLQPKKPPQNRFASRPTLLHNLLLPEIRRTVSNLSQTIRFLVDNDFLQNVELRPGEATEKPIQVISSSNAIENLPEHLQEP